MCKCAKYVSAGLNTSEKPNSLFAGYAISLEQILRYSGDLCPFIFELLKSSMLYYRVD